jgi:hypothetical protein
VAAIQVNTIVHVTQKYGEVGGRKMRKDGLHLETILDNGAGRAMEERRR